MLQGVLPLERSRFSAEVIAGTTLAALGIPEVMGYANIAQVPVVLGLYTILVPIAVFAVLGSSRHLVVGADSATAAILAAGLVGLATPESSQYVALAAAAALITGVVLIIARIVRLGFLADFLSRSVLIGFLTGVGIQVAMGQVGGMLGVPSGTGGTIEKFLGTLANIGETSVTTLAVSLSVLTIIVGCRKINNHIPGALIAVVGSIVVSWWWDLSSHGVSTLGPVPSGLPQFGLPDVGWSAVPDLLPTVGAIVLVILAQSAATSRAYAARYQETFSENVDLVGLGASNLAAGFSGTFVVNGSPTKTQMVDGAGGRSQLAQLTTAVVVLVVLLFLTVPLQYLPNAVLASVVFLIGIELVDIAGLKGILRVRIDEFVIAVITAAFVVVVGVEQAVVLAIVHVDPRLRPQGLSPVPHPRRTIRWRAPQGERPGIRRPGGARAGRLPLRRRPVLRQRQRPHRGRPGTGRRSRGRLDLHRRQRHLGHRLFGQQDPDRAPRHPRGAEHPSRPGRCEHRRARAAHRVRPVERARRGRAVRFGR